MLDRVLVGRGLSGVEETLLIPLYARALESKRPDALLVDERAVALLEEWPAEFERIEKIRMDEEDRVAIILRSSELDRQAQEFLARSPEPVVVQIGCGLDSRFERVDDGRVEWFDLDLPEVVEIRREVIGGERPRYHLLPYSVLESGWMDVVGALGGRSVLFLAEGVFTYFEEADVRSLVQTLRERFPGSELVFDAFSPLLVRANNLRFRLSRTTISARYRWGLRRGRDLESWAPGIRLLEEWFPFDHPEPRLARVRWVRHVPPLARVMGIYRYRLGAPGEPRDSGAAGRGRGDVALLAPGIPGRGPTAGQRFLVYGLAGWATDSLFVWLHTGRRTPSSLLNVPVYGLAQPLFEPLHDRVRSRPLVIRGAVYGLGILGVEYASGTVLRRFTGSAPWDYGDARLAIGGLVRLDYLPLWGIFGLGLERLHDALCAGRACEDAHALPSSSVPRAF